MPAQGRKAGPMPRRLLAVLVVSVLVLSAAAAPSFAASTSQEGYTTPAGVVQSDVAGAGALLVLLGVGMSRLTRTRARTE